VHLKRWVLSLARNCSRLMVKEQRWGGKEFQFLGAATGKLRLPNSDLVVGTYKSPRCAEQRPTLPLTLVSGVQTLRKYDGQVPEHSQRQKLQSCKKFVVVSVASGAHPVELA